MVRKENSKQRRKSWCWRRESLHPGPGWVGADPGPPSPHSPGAASTTAPSPPNFATPAPATAPTTVPYRCVPSERPLRIRAAAFVTSSRVGDASDRRGRCRRAERPHMATPSCSHACVRGVSYLDSLASTGLHAGPLGLSRKRSTVPWAATATRTVLECTPDHPPLPSTKRRRTDQTVIDKRNDRRACGAGGIQDQDAVDPAKYKVGCQSNLKASARDRAAIPSLSPNLIQLA